MKKYTSTIIVCLVSLSCYCISQPSSIIIKEIPLNEMSMIMGGANDCGSVCGKGADKECLKHSCPDCSGKENLECTSCGIVCHDDKSAKTCGAGGTSNSKCTNDKVLVCGMIHYVHTYRAVTATCYYSGVTIGAPNRYCDKPKSCEDT